MDRSVFVFYIALVFSYPYFLPSSISLFHILLFWPLSLLLSLVSFLFFFTNFLFSSFLSCLFFVLVSLTPLLVGIFSVPPLCLSVRLSPCLSVCLSLSLPVVFSFCDFYVHPGLASNKCFCYILLQGAIEKWVNPVICCNCKSLSTRYEVSVRQRYTWQT